MSVFRNGDHHDAAGGRDLIISRSQLPQLAVGETAGRNECEAESDGSSAVSALHGGRRDGDQGGRSFRGRHD